MLYKDYAGNSIRNLPCKDGVSLLDCCKCSNLPKCEKIKKKLFFLNVDPLSQNDQNLFISKLGIPRNVLEMVHSRQNLKLLIKYECMN